MAIADLSSANNKVLFPADSVVFPSVLEEYVGGRTVDVSTYTLDVINSGQVVIKETATGNYSLLPVTHADGTYTYGALPAGNEYVGLVRATKLVNDPFISIVYAGTANDKAMVVPITDAIKTAMIAVLPKLTFKAD